MASKNPVSDSPRQGSITVRVADVGGAGGVLSDALVSLYRAPVGTTGTKFNAKTWQAIEGDLLQSGRTDLEGNLTFTGLDPALYVVKYEHYPETPAMCVEVGAGCAEAVCLNLALRAYPD